MFSIARGLSRFLPSLLQNSRSTTCLLYSLHSFKTQLTPVQLKPFGLTLKKMPENTATTKFDDLPPALDITLDRSQFTKQILVFAVGLPLGKEFKNIQEKIKHFATGYLRLPKFTSTYFDANGQRRKLVFINNMIKENKKDLAEEFKGLDIEVPAKPAKEIEWLLAHPNALVQPDDSGVKDALPTRPCAYRLTINYDNFTMEQVLKSILPSDMDAVTGFSVVGHVAHFNLKTSALPYRKLIGEVVLDKLHQVRTVLHKAGRINNEFRNFTVDLMAGEENYLTTVKENGVAFKLDFSKVYWNSRLGTEHSRIVDEIKKVVDDRPVEVPTQTTIVYDVFAGVGPFSIPLARHGCQVFANDLNPASFEYLIANVKGNSSKRRPLDKNISCTNLDGREFIQKIVLPHYHKLTADEEAHPSSQEACPHVYMLMNLPGLAVEFLNAFGITDDNWPSGLTCQPPIHIRCYTFVKYTGSASSMDSNADKMQQKLDEADRDVQQRVCHAFGKKGLITDHSGLFTYWRVRFVRNVAPYKDMYCAEFDLHLPRHKETSDESDSKRPKIE